MKGGWLYFMTNRRDGVLYAGVTSNLPSRAFQHREVLSTTSTLMTFATRSSARRQSSTGHGPGKFGSSIRWTLIGTTSTIRSF